MQSPFDVQIKQTVAQLNPSGIIYKKHHGLIESQQLIEPYMKAFLNTPIDNISTRDDLLLEINRLITRAKQRNGNLFRELMPIIGQALTDDVYKEFKLQTKQHMTHINEITTQYGVFFPAFPNDSMYKY